MGTHFLFSSCITQRMDFSFLFSGLSHKHEFSSSVCRQPLDSSNRHRSRQSGLWPILETGFLYKSHPFGTSTWWWSPGIQNWLPTTYHYFAVTMEQTLETQLWLWCLTYRPQWSYCSYSTQFSRACIHNIFIYLKFKISLDWYHLETLLLWPQIPHARP